MFKQLRSAYNAGWRAGMNGGHYRDCPFTPRQVLRYHFWREGWQAGVKKRLSDWLDGRRVTS